MKFTQKIILMALSMGFILTYSVAAQQQSGVSSCAVMTTTGCTGATGARVCVLKRNIGVGPTMVPSCALTMTNNANCTIAMTITWLQTFNAVQTGTDPSCQWNCSICPDVTINALDGLPVELLGFGIEEPDSQRENEEKTDG